MRRKKVIALLISLTLLVSIAIPGTLAVSNDQEAASGSVTLPSGEQENNASAEGTKPAESPKPSETEQEPEKTCTCESTDGTHQEDCPLYTAPAAPAARQWWAWANPAASAAAGGDDPPAPLPRFCFHLRFQLPRASAPSARSGPAAGLPAAIGLSGHPRITASHNVKLVHCTTSRRELQALPALSGRRPGGIPRG